MDSRHFNLFFRQLGCNLIRAITLHRKRKYVAYYLGGFFVHKPVLAFLVPQITVNDSAGQVLAAHAFGLEYGADFPAGIAGVKLIHNVAERGKIIVPVQAVHTVIDSNQPDAFLP